ncbi:MAG: glycosyltransferase family 4 protein [Chryseolinea sp.]
MKVLIIHQHFRTPTEGGAIRSYYLAKALVDRGIEVVVITAGKNKKTTISNFEGIEVRWLNVPYDNSFGFWKRGFSFLRFAYDAYTTAKSIPSIDLCYAISVPLTTGLVARALKSRLNIPYIFEIGDLWPEAPIQLGYIRNPLFKRLLYGLEKSAYREARSLVALSTAIRSSVRTKVADDQKKIYLIPNMSDTDFYRPSTKDEALIKKLDVGSRFVVSYIGAVGIANGLDYFVECARASMQAGLPIRFFLCGQGALLDQHKQNVKRLELNNFTFHPFQNREGVKELMKVSDAVFVCYKPYRILETGSPNKYFDGLAAGKLIIINFEGWIKDEIEEASCGIAIDRKRPQEFVARILPFIKDCDLLTRYQTAARTLAVSKYARQKLSSEFAELIIENK